MVVPDLAANVETQGFGGLHKLRTLIILAGTMLLVCVPHLIGRIFFTRNDQSTNDTMVFIIAPVVCWALMMVIPVLMVRRAPRFMAFDCTWARWTRSELAWFWLLPLAVLILATPLAILHEWMGLPISWEVGFEHEFYKSRWLLVWLTSNAEALEFVAEGSRKPYYWPEYARERIALFGLAHGEERRHLGVALATRALVAARDQHDKAINDVFTCYRVGHHLLQCKDTISQLMGMTIYGLASQTARAILSHENISTELLVDLQQQLEGLAAEQPVRFDFRAEQLFVFDVIQRFFTDDGHEGGRIPRCFFTRRESPRKGLEYLLSDMAEAADADIGEWRKLDRRSATDNVRQ